MRCNPINAASKKRATPRGGFTFLELILVMAIIIIVTGMCYPTLSAWMQEQKLQEGIDQFRTSCVKARTRAMQEGRTYRLMPGNSSNTYAVGPYDPENASEDQAPEEFALPTGISIAEGGWIIDFKRDGTARVTVDNQELQLLAIVFQEQGGSNRQRTLNVRALTGAVSPLPVRTP